MKRLFQALFLLSLFLVPNTSLAIDEVASFTGPSVDSTDPSGNVSCFDNYRFGSVQADIETNLAQTVPGSTLSFTGKIKNDNDYPVVNGTLYIKVFKRTENTFSAGDGNTLVDQFPLKDSFTIPAKGDKPVSFSWHVPENIGGGDYYIATFFATEGRYNLMGLSFTDDVVGNTVDFSVTSDQKGSILLDKTKTTLNGEDHHFAAYPLHFKNDESVEVKTTLQNQSDTKQVIRLTWEEYVWDAMRAENQRNKKYELIEVEANSSKEVSYQVNPQNASVSYLVVTAEDQYGKSIQDIRFVRDGIEETRINFPSLSKFPLKAGETNSVFACAHSTNLPIVKDNILTLTLRDENQNVIHEYKYQGDISGSMGGWKDDFTPEKSYNKVTLTATLQRNNTVVEEVTIPYDCEAIDKNLCTSPLESILPGKKLGITLIILLSLIALFAIFLNKHKTMKRNNRFKVLFFALLLGGSILVPQGVEGKSVSWTSGSSPQLVYCWNRPFTHPTEGSEVQPRVCNTGAYNGTINWEKALNGATATVQYSATIINQSNGTPVLDGAVLPSGTPIQLQTTPHVPTDISWFGTGYSQDSPNGEWRSSANPPDWALQHYGNFISSVNAIGAVCNAKDLVANRDASTYGRVDGIYIPLVLDPPMSKSATVTNLSCGGVSVDGNGTLTQSCTVSAAGPVSVVFNIPATYGKYYYRYSDMGGWTGDPFSGYFDFIDDGCYGNQNALRTASQFSGTAVKENKLGNEYQLNVPAQSIAFNFSAISGNNPPTPPTLTGPTTGNAGTPYTYTATASDPDGDTLKYGMDWDNNGSVDEWMPASGFVASNTAQNYNHTWPTQGTYTFKVLAQDNKGANSGWSTPLTMTINATVSGLCGAANAFPTTNPPTIGLCTSGTPTPVTPGAAPGPYSWSCTGSGGGTDMACTAPYLVPAPVVDLKVNGSDGPVTINRNFNLNLFWGSIPNAVSCTGVGNGWSGVKSPAGGNDNIPATAASLYTLTCTNSQGLSASDSVSVTLQPTLKICENSCSSGIQPPTSFSMQRSTTKDLVACYNDATDCSDPTGNVNTSGVVWGEQGGNNAVSLNNTDPKLLRADNVGSETIRATYSGNTVTKGVTVTCTDNGACQRDPNYNNLCQKDTYQVTDNCGQVQNCNGTKTCDYNWKEVAP